MLLMLQYRKISFADFQALMISLETWQRWMKSQQGLVYGAPTFWSYKTFRSHSYIHISALMFWISLMFWVSCDHNSKVIVCNCLEFMLMANLCFGLWLEAKLGNDLECEYMFVTNFAFHSRCCLGFPHDHNMPQQSRAGKMEDNMLQIKVQQKRIITILMT